MRVKEAGGPNNERPATRQSPSQSTSAGVFYPNSPLSNWRGRMRPLDTAERAELETKPLPSFSFRELSAGQETLRKMLTTTAQLHN